jgi:uncharacterized protein
MSLVPESVMPHVRRFGFSGVIAAGVVVVMMFGINPISVITGQFSPPPPPTSRCSPLIRRSSGERRR